ncbi:hypothetical protein SKAU_G00164030 [Synaphobranchus kaupii]|uniref:Uncharacterized protein n=1 Tax=Synaphobranchus kaupii TaxID=118154 RepID=A0A9Q1FJ92_SYNKA|nr:hypothetical protein SKAU_G00164030 [Synaphobranchus kaupii]
MHFGLLESEERRAPRGFRPAGDAGDPSERDFLQMLGFTPAVDLCADAGRAFVVMRLVDGYVAGGQRRVCGLNGNHWPISEERRAPRGFRPAGDAGDPSERDFLQMLGFTPAVDLCADAGRAFVVMRLVDGYVAGGQRRVCGLNGNHWPIRAVTQEAVVLEMAEPGSHSLWA